MKLTKSQLNEIEVWKYFIPSNCEWLPETEHDIQMFFEWSQEGKHKDIARIPAYLPEGRTYFHSLIWGKRWAGIHMGMYEEGVIDGTMPYYQILGLYEGDTKVPRPVMEFMSKEMFQGVDRERINKLYDELPIWNK